MWIILIYKTKTNINTNRLPPPSFYSYPYGRWVITVQNFSVCVCMCVFHTGEVKEWGWILRIVSSSFFVCAMCVLSPPHPGPCYYTLLVFLYDTEKKERNFLPRTSFWILFWIFFCLHFFGSLFLFADLTMTSSNTFFKTHTKKKGKKERNWNIPWLWGIPLFFPMIDSTDFLHVIFYRPAMFLIRTIFLFPNNCIVFPIFFSSRAYGGWHTVWKR